MSGNFLDVGRQPGERTGLIGPLFFCGRRRLIVGRPTDSTDFLDSEKRTL